VLERHPAGQIVSACDPLPPSLCAKVFSHLTAGVAASCMALMEASRAALIIESMRIDRAAIILRRIDGDARQAILDAMPPVARERVRRLMQFPEGTVGAIMSSEAPALSGDTRVGEGKEQLASQPASASVNVWVLDRDGRFIGMVETGVLATASNEARLEDVASVPKATLSPHAALGTVLRQSAWTEADELPVVDAAGVFLGVLSHRRLRAWARTEIGGEEADAFRTFLGLGELMWLGLHGLVDAVASTVITEEQQ